MTEDELLKLERFFITEIPLDKIKEFQEEEAMPNRRALNIFMLFSAILKSKPAETATNEECRASLAEIRFAAHQLGFFSRMMEKIKKEEIRKQQEQEQNI